MKIGLLGISDYGLGILKWLVDNNYQIEFVTGKSKKVSHVTGVEKELMVFCEQKSLNYLGNVDCNSDLVCDLARKTDLCIIGGYDKILKKNFLDSPKLGVINTHFGILPQNRGCNPTMWAIVEGITQGVTTYWVNEKIDYGTVILSIEFPQLENKTSREAYDFITKKSLESFPEIMKKVENNYTEREMSGFGNYHPNGLPNDGFIDFNWDFVKQKKYSDSLWFPPYPPAKTKINEREYFIKINEFTENEVNLTLFLKPPF